MEGIDLKRRVLACEGLPVAVHRRLFRLEDIGRIVEAHAEAVVQIGLPAAGERDELVGMRRSEKQREKRQRRQEGARREQHTRNTRVIVAVHSKDSAPTHT